MSKKVCFIGSQGFIAKSLATRLVKNGYEVSSVGSKQCDLTKVGAAADLEKLLPQGATIVVTSAITPDRGKDASVTFKNVLIGENIFMALEKVLIEHLVYVSSDAVYSDGYDVVSEATPCEPSTLYGCGHIFKEKLFTEQSIRRSWPLSIIRPVAVFGPGDTHNSYGPNRFLRTALKSREITLFGEGEEIRDHIYIDNLCELFHRVIADRWSGIINAASGHARSFMEIAKEVAQICGRNVEIKCLPRNTEITHKHFDTTRQLRSFPDLSPIPFSAALQATCEAFKQEK